MVQVSTIFYLGFKFGSRMGSNVKKFFGRTLCSRFVPRLYGRNLGRLGGPDMSNEVGTEEIEDGTVLQVLYRNTVHS